MMIRPVSLFIGLRYIRAKRRNQFISFVSAFSLVGMLLGVMALIIVMSVMNGFDRELKQRLLSVVPHGFITAESPLEEWRGLAEEVAASPDVLAVAPYIESYGMVGFQSGVQGVQIQGVLPKYEARVSTIEAHMLAGSTERLQAGEYGIVLGSLLVRYLRLNIGDQLTLTLPQLNMTPAGIFPRARRFTLVGVFEVGAQVDQNLGLIHLHDAQKLKRLGTGVQGLRLKLSDIYRAAPLMKELKARLDESDGARADTLHVKDWSQTQGNLFEAIKMEKTVVGALLMIIVAVAAFNIISSLVLMVADKRGDIAVLRTMGLKAGEVMAVFMVQGTAVGAVGIVGGALLGSLLAWKIGVIVKGLEDFLGFTVFDPNVYFISHLPSHWLLSDVILISATALALSLLACIYPAWQAAQVQPAEAMRYE